MGDMLGEGAYGQVFKALNLENGNFLAVKVMRIPNYQPGDKKSLQILGKLEKEITLLKNLKHRNIVQYYDSCIINESEVNIFMEFMPGGSL
jgi:mitogen-activated protein kinase kinase kinase